jgi:holo-[acyl-carrier protein] synthase
MITDITLGLDLVDLERFAARLSPELISELFSIAEAEYCASKARPAQHYAARFAAKEAVMKALGAGLEQGVGFLDIEILRGEGGAVRVELHDEAARRAAELGITDWRITLTHTSKTAGATALGLINT